MTEKSRQRTFAVNAAVVFRLGEELITDVVQALVELVKNSYDADATWVKVTIDTRASNSWGRRFRDATGTIVVEDDGHGMTERAIEQGWLTIANSPKRQQKAAGHKTERGRTPIGDKGLGRLGSQRLAQNVEIITRPIVEKATEHYVAFSWADFRKANSLRNVPVTWRQSSSDGKKHGTQLILSDLCEPKMWQSEKYLEDLQKELSGMISPFEQARDFRVHLAVDGKRVELTEIAERVRETALQRYTFDFDGEVFHVSGVVRLSYLQPKGKKDRRLFWSLCRRDGGRALYAFLAAGRRRPQRFELSARSNWFVDFGTMRTLEDVGGVRRVDNVVANPGPFRGEVDAVSLVGSEIPSDVFDRQSTYRDLVRALAGIRVYRDGFGVRVGEDWLGLGKQWTAGTSYYGLRPANVLGYVAISARENPDLVETTSREGFQVTPHYENFVDLLSEFVRFAGNSQGYMRRGVTQFLSEHRERNAGVNPEETHSKVTQRLDDIGEILTTEIRKAEGRVASLAKVLHAASKATHDVRQEIARLTTSGGAVASRLEDIEGDLAMASKAADQVESALATMDPVTNLTSIRGVLDRRWNVLTEEVAALYEGVSLGLTAEALSHEINNIADRLAKKSASLLRQVNQGVRRAVIITFIEHVRSSVAAMRKQLAHLTPSLRYLRERRERIEVVPWAHELASFHNDILSRKRVQVVVSGDPSTRFVLNMNKGKLTQVFDNLILNSEYWLSEAIRAGLIENGEIAIYVSAPFVRVQDNGRGVEESVEESLFNPFVTTKRVGEGRGLGLFIVRQLLDTESCGIRLLAARNVYNRRFQFELDLSGATSG